MNWLRSSLGLVICLSTASVALGVTAFYSPSRGNVQISNEFLTTIRSITLISDASKLTGMPKAIPGASLDTSEQPIALTYYDFPSGSFDIGNVVESGSMLYDLRGYYFVTAHDVEAELVVRLVPEPTSFAVATVGLLFLVGWRTSRAVQSIDACGSDSRTGVAERRHAYAEGVAAFSPGLIAGAGANGS